MEHGWEFFKPYFVNWFHATTAKIWNHKSQQKDTKASLLGSASGEAEQRTMERRKFSLL